jgi:hypothetical protein
MGSREELSGAALGAIAAILLCLWIIASNIDYADRLDAEAREKEERAAAIQAEPVLPLSFPIDYAISITQSGNGIDVPRTVYVAGARRAE